MILIDAVKLKKSLPKYADYWEALAWIDEAEEVDAIPIEWLYQKRTLYLENECYMSLMVINEILNWWEAERGADK